MLTQIYVKNFILMDEVQLELHDNMSAFTGETGAGKSLLMDAIGILKGDRVNSDMIKEGCDKAVIEGVFELAPQHSVLQQLQDAGHECEDGLLIVTREVTREGRSIARINQRTTTVSFVKQIVSQLVDIHSQHDTQYLRNAASHQLLLDRFARDEDLLAKTKQSYHSYRSMKDALEEALHSDYNEDDLEFLTFQLNEIDEAQLQEEELEALEQEQKRMMAYEKLSSSASQAVALLDEGSVSSIYESYRLLHALHEDETFTDAAAQLLDLYYALDEQCSRVRTHLEELEFDEGRFHELQERIFLIHKIQRKYGGSYAAVMEKRSFLEKKIDSILHRQDFIAKSEKELEKARKVYEEDCMQLHALREKKAKELEQLILQQLKDLQLPNARFHVELEPFEGNAQGSDKITFLVSMNAGERLRPLQATASGGELSRFMLGLKTVFTRLTGIDTIIFDEIDTGVSGSVAFSIGKKMRQLAQRTQVFCVTHLASVAACAMQHYVVEKHQEGGHTETTIRLLNDKERIQEMAVISQGSTSESALQAAKELYELAKKETGNN